MKKLMVLAAVAVTAIASQAYDIKWGAKNIYIPVATDAAVSQSGIVATSGDKFAAGALTVSLFWVGSEGNNKIGDYATTTAGGIAQQVLASGTGSDLYAAMVADQGATWKPEYYYTATYTTKDGKYVFAGTVTATTQIGNLSSANVSVMGDFTKGSWDYTANPVDPTPEPTSGLLMLLGMAGLALRRKQK